MSSPNWNGGAVVLLADGVALLGLLLAPRPRPRMGGGSHRYSERVREGFARSMGFLAVSAL
jgi:hypothetical protein